MAKLGRKGRLWLKGFHHLSFVLWIGAAVSANIIHFLPVNATSGEELVAYWRAVSGLDLIIIPAAVLTLVTGLLATWLSGWGFKRFFVLYSLGIMVLAVVLGPVFLGPGVGTLLNLSSTQGLGAIQTAEYQQTYQLLAIVSTIQVLMLVSAVFVCTLKPLSKRKEISTMVSEPVKA